MFVKTIGIRITQPPITLPGAKYQAKHYATWRRSPSGSSIVHSASICFGSIDLSSYLQNERLPSAIVGAFAEHDEQEGE